MLVGALGRQRPRQRQRLPGPAAGVEPPQAGAAVALVGPDHGALRRGADGDDVEVRPVRVALAAARPLARLRIEEVGVLVRREDQALQVRVVAGGLVGVAGHPRVALEAPFAVDLVVAVDVLDRVLRGERDRVAVGLDVVDLRGGAAVGRVAAGEAQDQVELRREDGRAPVHVRPRQLRRRPQHPLVGGQSLSGRPRPWPGRRRGTPS